ncbi:hypothetical protein BGY98DRAFT_1100552 [Russula aff. rugulosa BPL654]|nr:hypothetical protein BGY98DRAFT_1100552 [Russula aff. rugulosa BPL654]
MLQESMLKTFDDIEVPPPSTDLNPEDFSSHVHITPAITEFHDADDADDSQSSDFSEIKEESELKQFTQALQKAQIIALKKENENKKKRRVYSKQSKRTLKCHAQQKVKMRLKGFLPLNEFFKLKSKKEDSNNIDALTPELDDTTKALREESEEGSDKLQEIAPMQDTCAHSVISISNGESEEILPQHNVRPRLRRFACMESEESTGDENNGNDGDYAKRSMGEDKTDDKETHITLAQLTKEAKRTDLDVIVQACIAAMVGLLNIYTDQNLQYSWIKTSQIVAKMQGRGTDHARHIRDWTMAYLRRRDLSLHQLKWKRPTIVDDEDLAEKIRTQMKEKVEKGFLKAEDVVEIVASPEI